MTDKQKGVERVEEILQQFGERILTLCKNEQYVNDAGREDIKTAINQIESLILAREKETYLRGYNKGWKAGVINGKNYA